MPLFVQVVDAVATQVEGQVWLAPLFVVQAAEVAVAAVPNQHTLYQLTEIYRAD
jgi:hypothetical protein